MKSFTRLFLLFFLSFTTLFSSAQKGDTLEIQRDQKGKISFARFKLAPVRNMQASANFLKIVLHAKPSDEFRLLKETSAGPGIFHRRYEQFYKGVRVDNAQYLVHGKNGMIETINGDFQVVDIPSVAPAVTVKRAIEKALAYVNAKKYKWEDEGMEKFIKERTNNPKATYYPQGELVISKDYIKGGQNFVLAWKLNISSLNPSNEQWIYVNAKTGEIAGDIPRLFDTNTSCTAETKYNGTKTITGDSYSGGYRLSESRNGVTIHTRNLQNQAGYANWVEFNNYNTNFTEGSWSNWMQDQHATDIHWGTEKALDYWSTVHSRNSIDGSGMSVINHAHYTWLGGSSNNAQWDGFANVLNYGDGNGSTHSPYAGIDVVGHEFGHGVTQYTSDLSYNPDNESAALHEGFSDIWGVCLEKWATSALDWLIGNDITYPAIRNLQNPHATMQGGFQYPDTYQGTYWVSGSDPASLVKKAHTNATVLGHWFYLLVNGGSGWNNGQTSHASSGSGYQWQVCPIALTDAEKISYKAHDYLTSSATYADARTATLSAAVALFGSGSCQEKAVKNAWYAVGIGTGDSPLPTSYTISGPNSFCSSGVYSLSPTPPAGSTIYWSANPSWAVSLTPGGSQVTAATSHSDVFTLSATVVNCCGSINATPKTNISAGVSDWSGFIWTSADQSVILQSWAEGYNYICQNTSVYFNIYGANSYTLVAGTVSYSNFDGFYQTFYMDPGSYATYAVSVTMNGCTQTLYFTFVAMDCPYLYYRGTPDSINPKPAIPIDDGKQTPLYRIAPNPVNSELIIYADIIRPNSASIQKVIVSDMFGKALKQQDYPSGTRKANLNVSSLASAMYIARVYDGKKWTSIKFIKN